MQCNEMYLTNMSIVSVSLAQLHCTIHTIIMCDSNYVCCGTVVQWVDVTCTLRVICEEIIHAWLHNMYSKNNVCTLHECR